MRFILLVMSLSYLKGKNFPLFFYFCQIKFKLDDHHHHHHEELESCQHDDDDDE